MSRLSCYRREITAVPAGWTTVVTSPRYQSVWAVADLFHTGDDTVPQSLHCFFCCAAQ